MTQVALVASNVATNVEPDQATANARYHPSLAVQFVSVPDGVQNGWIKTGSTWGAPPAPPPATGPTTTKIGPIPFMLRIPATARISTRAFAAGTDPTAPIVADFLRILDDQRTLEVDLADPAVIEGVEFLVSKGLLTQDQADTLLAPKPL